jgi:hypothetical protein
MNGPWDLKELLGAGHERGGGFLKKRSTSPYLLGAVFQKLPIDLRRRWWQETDYGHRPPSLKLVAEIADHITATARRCAKMLWEQEHPRCY